MRLQVLELPTRRVGSAEETPYILVLSEVDNPNLIAEYTPAEVEERFGARGLMVFSSPVDVGPPPPEPIRGATLQDFGFDPEKLKLDPQDALMFPAPPRDRC